MNLKNNIAIKGNVSITRMRSDKSIIESFTSKNMVVETGLKVLSHTWTPAAFRYQADFIALGAGVTATTFDMTAMESIAPTLESKFISSVQAIEPNIVTFESIFQGDEYIEKDVNEIGLFFANTAEFDNTEYMVARTVLPEEYRFTKGTDEYAKIVWRLTLGAIS